MRAISGQIHFSSFFPFLFPSPDHGWQGNPAVIKSQLTGENAKMSSKTGTPGNRAISTRLQ